MTLYIRIGIIEPVREAHSSLEIGALQNNDYCRSVNLADECRVKRRIRLSVGR